VSKSRTIRTRTLCEDVTTLLIWLFFKQRALSGPTQNGNKMGDAREERERGVKWGLYLRKQKQGGGRKIFTQGG